VQVVFALLISEVAAVAVFNLLIGILYTVGFWIAEGATPGKMALGIKLVMTDGEPISGGAAVGRYFAYFLSGITLGIGYLMIAFTRQKRGLHDFIAGTVAIKTR